MSKTEIIEELSKLTPSEREEIRAKIDELDGLDEEWDDLSDAEKKLIETRLANLERDPGASIPWSAVEARFKARYAK